MLPHQMADFLDLGDDDIFQLDDFCHREKGREGAASEAVEVMGDGPLCRAGNTKLFLDPGVFVELEGVAVEVIIVVWVIDGEFVRIDADYGALRGGLQFRGTFLRFSLDQG